MAATRQDTTGFDAIVIGAGIVGAACADALARDNLRVAIIEDKWIGSGATGAGMGHIVVMDDSPAQLALTHYSQMLWSSLKSQLPSTVEYEQTGTLWVAADEEEMAEVFRKHDVYAQYGLESTVLDRAALLTREPNLRSSLVGGLLVSSDSVLYPPTAAKFLVDRACAAGAVLLQDQSAVEAADSKVRLSDGRELHATCIVNASGASAARLSPGLPIRPRKGHLVITERYPGFLRHQLVELGYLKSAHSITADSVAFNVQPRKTGQLLIGSSRQFDCETSEVEMGILEALLARACEYMPALRGLSAIRAWTGLRMATPDHLPLIGRLAEDRSVLIAAGHEGLGITTSLATGQIIADQCMGRTPAIPDAPYAPSRFIREIAHA